jgi:glycine/D-amino acid oxidase-like deaminating enzyme/nitrite reductase/ring-hydroxylating ferredoxin subunit
VAQASQKRAAMYDSQRTSGESLPPWSTPSDLSVSSLGVVASTFDEPKESASWPDRTLDVVVIGAGITGLSTAYHLLEAGCSVMVIDKGRVACGETGRSTAHVSSALDDHYCMLERMHGASGARLAAESHVAAIASIEAIAKKEAIDCAFSRVDGYLFAAHAREIDLLDRELVAARRAGLEVDMVGGAPLPFATGAALRFRHQAQVQPVAYVEGLARAVRAKGGLIRTGVRVRHVEEGSPAKVHVDGGATVVARSVVVATNTPVVDVFAMHTKQAAYRSYAIGIPVEKGSIERALYWDTQDPYHYIRLAGDDDLLIVGGEDHKVGQSREPEHRWERLERWARDRFAIADGTEGARYRWSGQVWEPVDGLAFIGKNPGRADNVFISTGDSGNGITHGAIAGILLSDLIAGRENPWAGLYDPSRKVTRVLAAREFVKENLNVGLHYGDYLKPGEDPAHIARGEGAIVRRGVRRVAVYVDEVGQRHECAGVCTHLGGPISWNRAERSWDCPCHGARFDPYGRVMTGPALRDLERLETEPQETEPAHLARPAAE